MRRKGVHRTRTTQLNWLFGRHPAGCDFGSRTPLTGLVWIARESEHTNVKKPCFFVKHRTEESMSDANSNSFELFPCSALLIQVLEFVQFKF